MTCLSRWRRSISWTKTPPLGVKLGGEARTMPRLPSEGARIGRIMEYALVSLWGGIRLHCPGPSCIWLFRTRAFIDLSIFCWLGATRTLCGLPLFFIHTLLYVFRVERCGICYCFWSA